MTRILRILVFLGIAGGIVLALGGSPAAAKEPCWRTLINDWYDGRIDGIYPAKCYGEALKHAPEDVRGYSDLQSDLTRALQIAGRVHKSGQTYVSGGTQGHNAARSTAAHKKQSANDPIGRNPANGPVPQTIRRLGHSKADTVPLPLIALGGLALLLVASGAGGLLAKRLHARRGGGGTAP